MVRTLRHHLRKSPSCGQPYHFPYGLLLVQNPVNPSHWPPNPPTSWFWNVRVGDKLQLNNAGPWYTIVGPMSIGPSQGNTDMFVKREHPARSASTGTLDQWATDEYLMLVNGLGHRPRRAWRASTAPVTSATLTYAQRTSTLRSLRDAIGLV